MQHLEFGLTRWCLFVTDAGHIWLLRLLWI